MQQELKGFITTEILKYKLAYKSRNYLKAFNHLERIHVVSQAFPVEHTLVHLRMLLFAIKRLRPVEIFVQFIYSLFSAKFSLFKIFPRGNTGGANAVKKGRMAVPQDLQEIINNTKTK